MPKPGPAAGFTAITHPQKRAFLQAYSETMMVGKSSQAAGVSRHLHKWWIKHDPAYADAFAEAKDLAAEALEAEAIRRATMADKPSDLLLIFLLKGALPEKYKDRLEHTGAGGGPLQVQHMAPDARAARLAQLMARRNGHAPQPIEEVSA